MAKPDYTNEMETLAGRTRRLRALAADQKNEEIATKGGAGNTVASPSHQESDISTIPNEPASSKSGPKASRIDASLSGTVEQLIKSDKPTRLSHEAREWSRRLTYISTRIPEDMRGLIDDLLFVLKKEAKKELGREPTLQDLASEAWADLLGKYRDRLSM